MLERLNSNPDNLGSNFSQTIAKRSQNNTSMPLLLNCKPKQWAMGVLMYKMKKYMKGITAASTRVGHRAQTSAGHLIIYGSPTTGITPGGRRIKKLLN